MNTYLGIDYGGTKLIIGEVREDGELLRYRRYPTGLTGQKEIAAHLLQCLDNYVAEEAPGGQSPGSRNRHCRDQRLQKWDLAFCES